MQAFLYYSKIFSPDVCNSLARYCLNWILLRCCCFYFCCHSFSHCVNTLAINPQIKCNQFKFHTSIFIRNLFCILLMESELCCAASPGAGERSLSCAARGDGGSHRSQLWVAVRRALPGKEPVKWFFEILNPSLWPTTVATETLRKRTNKKW